jgi:hypothetical protein
MLISVSAVDSWHGLAQAADLKEQWLTSSADFALHLNIVLMFV